MRILRKGIIIVMSIFPCVTFAQKTVSIDIKADVHSISPYIFGTNESYEGATATRWGGNRSTSYNWENNASNSGNDMNFTSDNFYDYTLSKTAGLPIINATQDADGKGQYNLVSLQAAGYVAADKDGVVSEDEVAPSERWKPISFHKDITKSPYTLTPDTEDDTVYIDELINYLSVKLGKAGDGGVSAYAIDNEPYLWSQTHARLHPEKTTPEELIEKTVDLSSVIRKLAPGADIYGPMFFGWTDAYHWGYDGTAWNKFRRYKDSEGNINYHQWKWFVDYYLDTLQKVETATGIRPIDAIAFHWYPESYGTSTLKRIVDLDGNVSASELVAADMIEARLQAPRALWDSEYTYYGADGKESYVSQLGGKAIISKIKNSINTYYPGTKIAFTEFEYDAEDHWSGGLCLVDVLGVFAREDVYLACKWDIFKSYSIAAYNLYLNYDGKGSKFGGTSVQAIQSDTAAISSFASIDDDRNLHIITVNKTASSQNTTFNIANGIYENGVVYGFNHSSSEISQLGTIENIEDSQFTYELPAYSATHIILNALPQSEITKAEVLDPNDTKIVLSFEDEISINSAADAIDEFTVLVNDEEYPISAVSATGTQVTLTLDNAILPTDEDIVVSYLGTEVLGKSSLPIISFDTVFVYNNLKEAPLRLLSTNIDILGGYVTLSFSKEIGTVTNNGGLTIKQDDEIITIENATVSEDSPYDMYVYMETRLVKYKTTAISTSNNTDIVAKDGAALQDFAIETIGGGNYAPEIDSAFVIDNNTIQIYFSTNMDLDNDYSKLIISDGTNNYAFTYEYRKSIRSLVITTEEMLTAGNTYTLSYEDDGSIITIHNGVLPSLEMDLENTIEDMGATIVDIPGTVQGEQYWYRSGSPVVEESSDESELSSGYALGYLSTGDIITYKINVPESKNYTITLRYASQTNGACNFIIDGVKYHLTLPSTKGFQKWKDAYRVIPLTEGEHDVLLEIEVAGYNVNYFTFTDEEKYPAGYVSKATVPNKGASVLVTFNTGMEIIPTNDEVTLTVDDLVIPITAITANSDAAILCTFDTTIYKGQTVSIHIASATARNIDGGNIPDTTITVKNYSSQVYEEQTNITVINDDVVSIVPVPAHIGEAITITSTREKTLHYTVVSANGKTLESGSFRDNTQIFLKSAGIYTIIIRDEENIVTRKIIIR